MSTVPAEVQKPAPQFNVAIVSGRISLQRRLKNSDHKYATVLILPAPDSFSAPAAVEVFSQEPLGESGQDIRVKVQLAGFRRQFNATDRDTGEQSVVRTADNRLFAI